MPNQYENDSNYLSHFQSTGPEIWEQTNGKITHFFTGAGTGGTITGTGKFLKEKNNEIQVVAIQAQRNHLLQGLRNFEESAKPELFLRREEVVDDWYTATNDKSFRMVKQIALNENMLVGPSSGSVLASMIERRTRVLRTKIKYLWEYLLTMVASSKVCTRNNQYLQTMNLKII